MSKIYKYIVLSSLFFFFWQDVLLAEKIERKDSVRPRIWQGMMIELDVVPYVQKILLKQDLISHQVHLQANLGNHFFPVLEGGFAEATKTNNDITFVGNGGFAKLGIDFNLLKKKNTASVFRNYALGGLRIGYSATRFSIKNQLISDAYWGGTEAVKIDNVLAHKLWAEINLSLRTPVFRNIYMGWNIRSKHLITREKEGSVSMLWYIPGFGLNNTPNWGFSYIIGYRF